MVDTLYLSSSSPSNGEWVRPSSDDEVGEWLLPLLVLPLLSLLNFRSRSRSNSLRPLISWYCFTDVGSPSSKLDERSKESTMPLTRPLGCFPVWVGTCEWECLEGEIADDIIGSIVFGGENRSSVEDEDDAEEYSGNPFGNGGWGWEAERRLRWGVESLPSSLMSTVSSDGEEGKCPSIWFPNPHIWPLRTFCRKVWDALRRADFHSLFTP